MKISEGDKAPAFTLPDQNGDTHKLSDYKGKWVLVYFYPRDFTPGCTKEACEFRDNWAEFKKRNIVVLGISMDSVERHEKMAAKHELPFTLLSDEKKEVVKKYGVYAKKKLAGRSYFGIKRMSFLIDPKGKVIKVYEKVKPTEHALQVLEDHKELT